MSNEQRAKNDHGGVVITGTSSGIGRASALLLVEPGAINTPAVEKTLCDVEGRIAQLPPEGAKRYGAMWRAFTRKAYAMERDGSPPEVVAQVVLQALTARNPRAR